jgi:hypothetical protein
MNVETVEMDRSGTTREATTYYGSSTTASFYKAYKYPDIYSRPTRANTLSFDRDFPRPYCQKLNVAVHTRYVDSSKYMGWYYTNQPITSSWLLPEKLMVAHSPSCSQDTFTGLRLSLPPSSLLWFWVPFFGFPARYTRHFSAPVLLLDTPQLLRLSVQTMTYLQSNRFPNHTL